MGRRRWIAGAGAVVFAAVLAAALPAKSDESGWGEAAVRARFKDPDVGADPATFAKNFQCKECHPERVTSLATSFHAKFGDVKKDESRGCQECHGAGLEHADEDSQRIRNPNRAADLPDAATPAKPKPGDDPRPVFVVPVKEANGMCVRCHVEIFTKPKALPGHRDFIARTRDPSGERSCVSCHMVHVDKAAPEYDKKRPAFADVKEMLAQKIDYVDPARCIACHSEYHPQMAGSGHAFLTKDDEKLHGCGACHGAGLLHAKSGGRPTKILMPPKQKPADADATCNACHKNGAALAKWTCAEHGRQGVTCIECHDPNAAKGRTLRRPPGVSEEEFRRAPQFHLCSRCHLDVAAQLRLPSRHRVAEGRVSCSDCHDPHGNTDKVRDKDVRLRACLACHQEKGGPFLFDHGIKRTEGCVACHDPHGSANRRMLTYPRIQAMCIQCHAETPHDLRLSRYDNCLGCHTEIHGSDLDRLFRK